MGTLVFGPWPPVSHANLSIVQISRELGKSRKTIRRYVEAGMPHEPDAGGRPRFNLQKCLKWLDSQKETA